MLPLFAVVAAAANASLHVLALFAANASLLVLLLFAANASLLVSPLFAVAAAVANAFLHVSPLLAASLYTASLLSMLPLLAIAAAANAATAAAAAGTAAGMCAQQRCLTRDRRKPGHAATVASAGEGGCQAEEGLAAQHITHILRHSGKSASKP